MKAKNQEFYGSRPDRSPDYTRMITEFHAKRIVDMIKENHGGTIIYGGDADPDNRWVYIYNIYICFELIL